MNKQRIDVVPDEEAWGDYRGDLDQQAAYRTFFGKKADDLVDAFENAPIERADEIRFMPDVPLAYYLLAFGKYMDSPHVLQSVNAPDAASSFLSLLLEKAISSPSALEPVLPELISVAERVANRQSELGADTDIYGDFAGMLTRIRAASKAG